MARFTCAPADGRCDPTCTEGYLQCNVIPPACDEAAGYQLCGTKCVKCDAATSVCDPWGGFCVLRVPLTAPPKLSQLPPIIVDVSGDAASAQHSMSPIVVLSSVEWEAWVANNATSDVAALVALYNATSGPFWRRKDGWLQGHPCDNHWYGVACGAGSRVV